MDLLITMQMCSMAKCLFPHPRPSPRLVPTAPSASAVINASATPAVSGATPAHCACRPERGPLLPPRVFAPRTELPVPPPGTQGQTCRQAPGGVKPWVPVLKAFVAAGLARRALLNVRSPCELGSFPLTSFSAYFQKGKK